MTKFTSVILALLTITTIVSMILVPIIYTIDPFAAMTSTEKLPGQSFTIHQVYQVIKRFNQANVKQTTIREVQISINNVVILTSIELLVFSLFMFYKSQYFRTQLFLLVTSSVLPSIMLHFFRIRFESLSHDVIIVEYGALLYVFLINVLIVVGLVGLEVFWNIEAKDDSDESKDERVQTKGIETNVIERV
jgi:hypothetical protein